MLPHNSMSLANFESQLNHFKVNELQTLLSHFKVQKMGKKSELHQRCVDLLRNPRTQATAIEKIRDIATKASTRPSPYPQIGGGSSGGGGGMANGAYLNSIMGYRPNNQMGQYGQYPMQNHMPMHNMQNTSQWSTSQTFAPRPARNLIVMPLPFYDPVETLLEPQELPANPNGVKMPARMAITFGIPARHGVRLQRELNAFPRLEIQLRFFNATGDIAGIEQPDDFPLNCSVKLDDSPVTLPNVIPTNKPNVEPKRPSRPVNLTDKCIPFRDNNQHRLLVEWTADKRTWAVAIYVVERQNSDLLQSRVTSNKSFEQSYHVTEAVVRKRLGGDDDEDVAMDTLKISLLCPLGRTRMALAARSRDCTHLQCFDLSNFLQMNEKRPTWKCCVCNNSAPYSKLIIDQYFMKMLRDMDRNVTEVELLKDGTFRTVKEEVMDLSDDDDDVAHYSRDDGPVKPQNGGSTSSSIVAPEKEKSNATSSKVNAASSKVDDDVITLSDDDEDDIQLQNAIKASQPTTAPHSTISGMKSPSGSGDDSIIVLDDTPPRNNTVRKEPSTPSSIPLPPMPPSNSSTSTNCATPQSPFSPVPPPPPSHNQPSSSSNSHVASPTSNGHDTMGGDSWRLNPPPTSSTLRLSATNGETPPTNLMDALTQTLGSHTVLGIQQQQQIGSHHNGGPHSAGVVPQHMQGQVFGWSMQQQQRPQPMHQQQQQQQQSYGMMRQPPPSAPPTSNHHWNNPFQMAPQQPNDQSPFAYNRMLYPQMPQHHQQDHHGYQGYMG